MRDESSKSIGQMSGDIRMSQSSAGESMTAIRKTKKETSGVQDVGLNSASVNASEPTSCSMNVEVSMSSAEDSHARIFQLQEKERESMESEVGCGVNTSGSFARLDRDSSLWKTSQRSLFEGLIEFSETWPKAGLMRNGTAYQRVSLVRNIEEIESGLWPTPNTRGYRSDGELRLLSRAVDSKEEYVAMSHNATASKRLKMWPTPKANDAEKRGNIDATNPRNGLPAAVKLFPTPRASNCKGSGPRGSKSQRHLEERGYLTGVVATEQSGQLNPQWVEWLMGFPSGWTDLDA